MAEKKALEGVFAILEKGKVAALAEEPTAPTLREEEGWSPC